MEISSSLSGLQVDFSKLSTSITEYVGLMQDQVRDLKSERDAAKLQARVWRLGALVGGGVAVIGVIVLVTVLIARK
jgi:hypothetical protein